MKRMLVNAAICALLFLLPVSMGCGKAGVSASSKEDNPASGASETVEDSNIKITLSTDKETYQKGEEIKYSLTLENGRKGYTISRVTVEDSNDEVLTEEKNPSFSGMIKTGESSVYEGTLYAFSDVKYTKTPEAKIAMTGEIEKVTLRPYIKVNCDGQDVTIRYIVEVIMFKNKVQIPADKKVNLKTAVCHDPAILVGKDKEGKKCYYIYGSHRAYYKSYDLQNWEAFTSNLSKDYRKILEEPAKWSAHGSKKYQVDGNMWAPDVMYNKAMGKYCMYLSVNGDNWYSSIVLLTADSPEGDWTYEGIVVYSGFHSKDFYDETDVAEVTGETEYPARYAKGKLWGNYYPNNIDACVYYDKEGKLYLTYGSWSGGIFLLELDEETGFRDKSVTYEDNQHSDPYFGKKIAGGQYVSGEASYVEKIGDYYWLFMCYGALEAKGGYNVRVFRSLSPDGDFLDKIGNDTFFDRYQQNFNLPIGVRLFGGYKWDTFYQGQVAQGHNSAFVDDDGKAYMVFHTRTTDGSEGHYVKVHQLFLNKDQWLVAAPYQTSGETLKETGYDVKTVAGSYEVILHKLNINYSAYELNSPVYVDLNEDGTVTGEYQGTWSLEAGTPYIDITIDGVTYSGVTLEMNVEGSTIPTMTFTALGDSNQLTLWGSRSIE